MPSIEVSHLGHEQGRVDPALFPESRSERANDDRLPANTYLTNTFKALLHFNLPLKILCRFFS